MATKSPFSLQYKTVIWLDCICIIPLRFTFELVVTIIIFNLISTIPDGLKFLQYIYSSFRIDEAIIYMHVHIFQKELSHPTSFLFLPYHCSESLHCICNLLFRHLLKLFHISNFSIKIILGAYLAHWLRHVCPLSECLGSVPGSGSCHQPPVTNAGSGRQQ